MRPLLCQKLLKTVLIVRNVVLKLMPGVIVLNLDTFNAIDAKTITASINLPRADQNVSINTQILSAQNVAQE